MIEFNRLKIGSYRLIGYENRLLAEEDFNNDRKDAGEMGAGHNVTALYELVPAGSDESVPAVDPLKYQDSKRDNYGNIDLTDEFLTIKIRYKKPDDEKSMLMVKPVSGSVSQIINSSDNLRFASAVAEFGMLLRYSEYKGSATFEAAASLARSARGEDEEGYRSELIRMIDTVKDMTALTEKQ